jgi:hypothetical protein
LNRLTYNNEYMDLGELGEHELHITATNVGKWDDPVSILILFAVVFVVLDGSVRELDVTSVVRKSELWRERVTAAYMQAKDVE